MKIKFTSQDGQILEAEAQKVAGKLWVHAQGRTFIYEPEERSGRKKGAGKAKSGDLLSPMPGKVTKILKNSGDQVQAGDVILVMEAMKMEYTLKSEVGGTVESINCKAGDQVTLGKLLAKIKENT